MEKIRLLVLAIILLVGVLSGCSSGQQEVANETVNSEAVEVLNPYTKDIAISNTLSGKLSAIEDVMIMAEIPAKVTSVRVKIGDRVSEGDVLFTLDDENVRKQIEQAQAGYNLAAKNLEMQMEQIQNAKVNLERIEKLYNEGAVSKQQFEQAKLGASEANVEALKAQVNQAKVGLDQALSQLEKTVVKSPIDGFAAAINIQENEFATNSQPAMRIVNTDKLTVNLGVSEEIINKIREGQKVNVKVKVALDETIEGIVKAVSPVPDDRTQIYPVEIEIDNSSGIIKPGMFAEIIFNVEEVKDVLVVPSNSIIERNQNKFVYVVENNKAKIKEVKTGLDDGKVVEIKEGLSKDDKVIVKGQDFVEDGVEVRIVRGEE